MMPRKTLLCAAILFAGLECVSPLPGCTAFSLDDRGALIFGANFDHQIHEGMLFVNKRGVSKRGWSELPNAETHAAWTSKYGSVSFNLVMSQSVWGGMNEAGLMLSTLYLSDCRPTRRQRSTMPSRPWLRSRAGSPSGALSSIQGTRDSTTGRGSIRMSDRSIWRR